MSMHTIPDQERLATEGRLVDTDAYGAILRARHGGGEAWEIIERDDGMVWAGDPSDYFAPFRSWPAPERRAMRFVRGRVLDVGCGAGRVSLHLQARGLEVVAIDTSPGAVSVAIDRGVRVAVVADLLRLPADLGLFDTIVIARNNAGLGGDERGRRRLLRLLAARTTENGRIITDSVDPSRIPGDRRPERDHRYRCRWLGATSPWFRYAMCAPTDAPTLADGSGWRVARIFDDGSARWSMVLEKR